MRLLIVEDEPNLLTTLAAQLRNEGYAVDVAANGRDGLHLGNEYPIDLAILDLGLPEIAKKKVLKVHICADTRFGLGAKKKSHLLRICCANGAQC